jgi:DNA gyrase inhibitor GyrI
LSWANLFLKQWQWLQEKHLMSRNQVAGCCQDNPHATDPEYTSYMKAA